MSRAAAASEQIEFGYAEYLADPVLRLVEAAPEMAEDQLIRMRAARFIGSCVLNNEVVPTTIENMPTQKPIESLFDGIRKAAKGDKPALEMVKINTRTDVIERTIKTGHVTKVILHRDRSGVIQQNGQNIETVHANNLRYAASSWQMRERSEAEATNAFRIEQHQRSGKLEDHSFVVFSRAADNMTENEMAETGFFTDTMSCAIQVTSAKGDVITTESAFVSGVKEPGGQRHDADTIITLAAKLGVDLKGKSAAEIINIPILIHNSLLPNGAIDIVKLYDDCAGGTFFGENRPRQKYVEYKAKCEARESMLQPKVDTIVNELISESSTINNPLDAITRLNKLSEKHMVEQAAFDYEINPRVFGSKAADYIEQARHQFELGDNSAGLELIHRAKITAASKSCPSSLEKSLSDSSDNEADETSEAKNNDTGECEFVSKECPMCGTKNVKTKVTKTHITGSCGCSLKK